MKCSVRAKLVASFLSVIAISGFITVWLGVHLIGNETIERAQDKVRMDLNSAREVYAQRLNAISEVVRLTTIRFFLKESLVTGDLEPMKAELQKILETENLDVFTVVDSNGDVVFRARNPRIHGDNQAADEIVAQVLLTGENVAATQIVSRENLANEGAELAEQAHIAFVPTPKAKPRPESDETSGMMMKAAAPVFDYDGDLIGVLYGARLLNRNYEIVDTVKEIVYQGEIYKGRDIGSVTIFQGDLRISTNVLGSDGRRATGTRVSEEVYNQVIVNGIPWVARAFVVNDWYITAYEPLRNIRGDVIGMLYVGMLEAPYADLKKRIILSLSAVTAITVILLSVVLYLTTSDIIRPLKELLRATQRVAKGYLAHRVEVQSNDELGELATSFNMMTAELQKATHDYQALTRTLEEKVQERTRQLEETRNQLFQSEKLASLGKMAAGVAHEINNPLTSVLINSHLIAESLGDKADVEEYLKLIIDETTRCSGIVKGLLDFSRQSSFEKRPVDVNRLIEETMVLLKSNILESRVEVKEYLSDDLPTIMLDANKIKQVFTNVVLNALESMPEGGTLAISSRAWVTQEGRWAQVVFEDTGCGIPEDMMPKIFDPFFSTKPTRGTGLGLSVSYGIVEQHEGKIDVQSNVGKGTTVTLVFPIGE